MPLYHYACAACGKIMRRICTPEESQKLPVCCNNNMTRTPKPATLRVVEVLDNGAMSKKLERLSEAERLFHERAQATKKQRGR